MEREVSSSSDVRTELKRLLQTHFHGESQLLIDLLNHDFLGLDPFETLIDGISLKIKKDEPKASIDQKLETFFKALERKNKEKEAEKEKDREIEELKERLRAAMERIKFYEQQELQMQSTRQADVPNNISTRSPSTKSPQTSTPPSETIHQHISRLTDNPEYEEAAHIFRVEIIPLYRDFAEKYKCTKNHYPTDVASHMWFLKKVAAVLDTQKGASPERGQARQVIAQEKSLKQKMCLIADFIKKFM